jgi:hypothetical protein
MITIQHQEKQWEIHLSFSTAWTGRLIKAMNAMLDFSEVHALRKQKDIMIHEMGIDVRRINL